MVELYNVAQIRQRGLKMPNYELLKYNIEANGSLKTLLYYNAKSPLELSVNCMDELTVRLNSV